MNGEMMENTWKLTSHELLALVGMSTSSAAATSRAVLQLPEDDSASDFELLGAATLVARDLAIVEGDDLTPVDRAHHVAVALGSATRWVELAVISGETVASFVLVASPVGGLALQARELGVREVTPLDPAADVVDLGTALVRERFDAHAGDDTLGSLRVVDDGAVRVSSLRRDAGTWSVWGPGLVDEVDRTEPQIMTEAEVWSVWDVGLGGGPLTDHP